jgi:hypothetical protein
MAGRDPKESDRGSFGSPPILFPVAKRVNAYAHRFSEPSLRQTNETAKRSDIFAGLELACDQTLPDSRWHRPRELLRRELRSLRHRHPSIEER